MNDSQKADLQKLTQYEMAWPTHDGLTHPNWELIDYWFSDSVPEAELDAVWTAIADHWLQRLITELGNGYDLYSLDDYRLVGNEGEATANHFLRFAQRSVRKTLSLLPQIASDDGPGTQVTLLFSDQDAYYRYTDRYYADMDKDAFGGSAGMCVRSGFTHIVINRCERWERERTIAHEYAHALLSHLAPPRWVEEGLVQLVETAVMDEPLAGLTVDMIHEHIDFWDDDTLAEFWTGESFHRPDEGQHLSYQLALWMANELMRDRKEAFVSAINAFDPDTPFDLTLRETMGCDPFDLLPPFLQGHAR